MCNDLWEGHLILVFIATFIFSFLFTFPTIRRRFWGAFLAGWRVRSRGRRAARAGPLPLRGDPRRDARPLPLGLVSVFLLLLLVASDRRLILAKVGPCTLRGRIIWRTAHLSSICRSNDRRAAAAAAAASDHHRSERLTRANRLHDLKPSNFRRF